MLTHYTNKVDIVNNINIVNIPAKHQQAEMINMSMLSCQY